jgi:two-component system response regulator YesN
MYCLLIDDDVPTIHVLRDMIDWAKFGVTKIESAHNIFDAMHLFEERVPDIIICDIEMPKGSGLDMIRWVRERNYDCAYIFFTCHQSFEYASAAITYHADAYLTKPFEPSKLEVELLRVIDHLRKHREQDEYSRYGQKWITNKDRVEQSFWSDVYFRAIVPGEDFVRAEIAKRGLDIEPEQQYRLALACVNKMEMNMEWDSSNFQLAFRNISSEMLFGTIDHPRLISYHDDGNYYLAMIMEDDLTDNDMQQALESMMEQVRKLLRCTVTCYWSDAIPIWKIEQTRSSLEKIDRENIIYRGRAHNRSFMGERISQPYALDVDRIFDLFIRGERVQIVNLLKNELHMLTIQNKLDLQTIRTIRHDFMQIAYSLLYKNNIQAHRLFADEVTRKLEKEADSNLYNFMKWVAYVTNKTIDFIKEVAESESIVEKVKRYIHEHYHQDVNREKLAEIVYLTPDYIAKRFKMETGLSITEYLNDYRIRKAREMLLQDQASISDIAINTGYDSVSYFSTVFKKLTGCSPNAYRARHKAVATNQKPV